MATTYKLSNGSSYANATVYPVGSGVRVRRLLANGSGPDMSNGGVISTFSAPAPIGRATGRVLQPTSSTDSKGIPVDGWMEVTTSANVTGWVRFDLLSRIPPTTAIKENDAKTLMTALVNRDVRIARTLAYCKILLDKAGKPTGANAVKLQQCAAQYDELSTNLKNRQLALQQQTSLVKVTRFANPMDLLVGNKSVSGVGAFPVIGAVVIGIALLVAAAVAWKHFEPHGKAGEIDLNKSRTLAEVLQSLEPEKAKKLLSEINTYGEEQYDKGTNESGGTLGGMADILKWGALGFVAVKLFGGRQQGGS